MVSVRSMVSTRLTMSRVNRAPAFVLALLFYCCINFTEAQTSTPSPAPTSCASKSNTTCDECLQNVKCLWCTPTKQCMDYPVRRILPPSSVCPLNDARWGVCWVNFQILIITMSVLGGVIIVAMIVCCCCCCRKKERAGNNKEDEKEERQNRARKNRQKERRTEMHLRHDEIRTKYGLAKDNPYARMDDR